MPRLYKIQFLLLLLSALWATSGLAQSLFINEFMGSNQTTLADEDGEFSDWVEIYNAGPAAADLTGYYLSDDPGSPAKWAFPEGLVPAGGFLLVWASDKDKVTAGGELHTNFKISSDGEPLLLTLPDGATLVDQSPAKDLEGDESYGRLPDGTTTWESFEDCTPGTSNSLSLPSLPAPTFSHAPGYHPTPIQMVLTVEAPEAFITYTLDGSEPTESSPLFSGSVSLTDRAGDLEVYSLIPTNFLDPAIHIGWRPPVSEIFKINVLRARAFAPGHSPSRITTGSYIIGGNFAQDCPYPVVSLVSEPGNFFADDIGIYVPGNTYTGGNTGNYFLSGDLWERPVHVEVFDDNGSLLLAQDTGMRISGNMTVRFPQKTLKLYARDEYGDDDFDCELFPDLPFDSYKRFRIRNAGNDWAIRGFGDLCSHEILGGMGFDVQAGRPTWHFIDGEFWGLANLREEYSRFYYERHYDIPDEDVVLLTCNSTIDDGPPGCNSHYQNMLAYIAANDMSDPAVYAQVNTLMDVENYIAYVTAEIYAANPDWPGNNISFWRRNTEDYEPYAPYGHDGRWRWSLYDLDDTFRLYDLNLLEQATAPDGPAWPNPPWSTELLRGMLESPLFCVDFINSFADHINSTFQSGRLVDIIDEYAVEYAPALPFVINRWDTGNYYNGTVNKIKTFTVQRPAIQQQHIVDHFGLAGTSDIQLSVSDDAMGHIRINSLFIDETLIGLADSAHPYPWAGTYFQGNPVTITAVPEPGYVFSSWLETGNDTPSITLTPGPTDTLLTAVFAAETSPPVVVHYWHFNDLPDGPLVQVAADLSLVGAPCITYPGTDVGYLDSVTGTDLGALPDIEGDTGLRVRNPSATRQLVLELPTTGYANPKLQFALWRSSSGPREVWVEYTTDPEPSTWHGFGDMLVPTEAPVQVSLDFSGVPLASDNEDFRVRFIYSGDYATGTLGNTRYDNLALHARRNIVSPVPDEDGIVAARGLRIKAVPNPFNPTTHIEFAMDRPGPVIVEIFALNGYRVRTLLNGQSEAGLKSVPWHGEDDQGRSLSSGTYLCRIRTNDQSQTMKLQLVR